MIRSNAQESFDRIFRKAARTRLVRQAEDMCQIGTAAEGDSVNGEEALILTISSIAFRLLLVLRFDESDATRTYFTGEGAGRSFEEARLEIGNLCCGALNQELLQVFPDLGMSTPYVVSARCLPYLDVLKPGYVATYAVTINDMVRVDATVCVCAHAPLDFVADVSDEVESGGELELF
ncbi:Uncharacterised protein [Ralstonia pickettii]|uniref:hypothetical protein n=1 Tax=Ralstonia TaxID=48736 RepID=UPI0001E6A158|nr:MULTISPECIES: hypothetical protein [Ralstonia]MBU6524723.1 hypothetical protein [Ralstonia sp. B265]NPT48341.1 hypothetical protein [Ralstonia sp. 3N]EFP67588.1 hypothetical protein HMPREF1004_00747 [Ralstonia pickettii]EGY65688.1 hypothetical protein HMPREF0989_00191 [Ralstonia sp. 5_2_56FAA]KFL23106.1 hypothetical protein DP23_2672 [Ralstonia pickettii]